MPTANVVDVSQWQPTSIDWANLKANGVQAVIVRIGHGTTQDTNAADHISNASKAGLIVHVYHYYEGVDGELDYSASNAKSLNIQPNVYYFLDMEGTIAGSWPSIFESFRQQWSNYGWNTGLYCSLSNYAKFDDATLVSQNVYRWVAAWGSNPPSNADMWQYDSKTGLGNYTSALDKDVDITGRLIKQPDNTIVKPTDPNGTYPIKPGAFVGFDYSTTELAGGKMLVASPDGVNKIPKLGPDGSFLFNSKDAQTMGGMLIEGNSALATSDDLAAAKAAASQIASSARSAADSAYSMASQAIEQASVTKKAQSAAASAATEASQGATDAMSQAQSAWSQAMIAVGTANSAQYSANQATSSVAMLSTNVDTIKGNVTELQATITTQADAIKSKVTSSDVTGMLTGFATQEYAQSLVTQTADQWNLNLTQLKNDNQTSMSNLSATVDGIKSEVYNSDGSSKITQLSNVVQLKVGTDDFNNLKQTVDLQTLNSADLNAMKTNGHYLVAQPTNSPISGWVYVDVTGGVIEGYERIRQDVYQDNGNQHKYRRWVDDHWLDWEEGATYSEITQLKDDINLRVTKGDLISQINLEAGTALIQSNKLVLDAETTVFTGNAFIPSAAICNITADKITLGSTSLWDLNGTLNLVNINGGTKSKITATNGDVYVDGIKQNASIIQFSSDMNTNAFTVTPAGATVTPTLFFESYDQIPGHWLGFTRNKIVNEGVEFHTWDDDGERFGIDCHARFNKNIRVIGTISQGSWDGTPGQPNSGVLTIKNGNTIWSGSNFLALGDNLSNTYTNVMAKSFSQQSTLSAKTNIQPVDPKDALDLINRTDIYSYQYKSDVAVGSTKRYASLIIDDVNDVSQYYAPDEFINEKRTGRDDGSTVGYLVLAVKELTSRIKALESQAK